MVAANSRNNEDTSRFLDFVESGDIDGLNLKIISSIPIGQCTRQSISSIGRVPIEILPGKRHIT